MANKPAITLEIGAAVDSSVGTAFNATKDGIDELQVNLDKALALQGAMDRRINVLRAQGLEIKDLSARYEALGEAIKGYRQQAQGLEQIAQGRAVLAALPGLIKVAAKPVAVSADYQAQLRDISLKTNLDAASEADVSREVIATSRNTGMSRSQVVQLLGQMLDNGMSLQDARDNLPTAATFAVGQNASIGDTAGLVRSLQLAKVDSPQKVREALTLLVTQAKAGTFESAELAKWIPKLLPSLEGKEQGVAAVAEIGALLQAQMSDSNGTDEAARKVEAYVSAKRQATASAKDGIAAQAPRSFTGDREVLQRRRAPVDLRSTVLEDDLQSRQLLSGQKWSQSADALDDLQRSLGDGMRPVTDILAEGATYVLRRLTDLADACPVVVTALTGVAATGLAVGAVYRALQVGKGVLDLGKGLFREREALKRKGLSEMLSQPSSGPALGGRQPIDVRVVNVAALGRSGKGRPGRKRNAKAPAARRHPAPAADAARETRARTSGAKARLWTPSGLGFGFAGAPVAPAMRKQGPLPRRVIAQHSGDLRVSAGGPTGVAAHSSGLRGASLGRGLLKRLPGVSLLDTGMQIAQTYQGNGTPQEKLEGYGTAVGGLGGALAGAAAGAAIGSVVPVVGTAIGGLIGGVLGGAGGENLGGWLAKAWSSMSTPDKPLAKPEAAPAPTQVGAVARDLGAAVTAAPADMVTPGATPTATPSPVNQQFTFTSNMPVTFNNSLDDPSVLQQLEMIARRQLEELMRQARSAQLVDTPHIAL